MKETAAMLLAYIGYPEKAAAAADSANRLTGRVEGITNQAFGEEVKNRLRDLH